MTEPTTLTNSVVPGTGYFHLNRPVPTPCRLTLSPDTPYAEAVPAYRCTDDQPPMVMLGYGDPHADRVVLANAHTAGSPVCVEPAECLPPFSGKDGACPKCGCRCAQTRYLRTLTDPQRQIGLLGENGPWYAGYFSGGNAWRPFPSVTGIAPWWPDEWLGRLCMICGFRWDEAVVDTAQGGGGE
jgi:hypothetical protein